MSRISLRSLSVLVASLTTATCAWAAPTVPNFSFENPTTTTFTAGGNGNTTAIAGYTIGIVQGGGLNNQAGVSLSAAATDGSQIGYLNLFNSTDSITTTNAVDTIPLTGDVYTLTVAARENTNNSPNNSFFIEFLANGNLVSPTASFSFQLTNTFTDLTAVYAAPATIGGQALTYRFVASRGNSQFDQIGLDNVRLTSATTVPEPASLSVLGLGALALLRRRR